MISRCHICERVGLAVALAALLGVIIFAGSVVQFVIDRAP